MSDAAFAGPRSHTFHGLDALRGIAAVVVMLFHMGPSVGAPWLAPSGYLAVDLFFVMSGFVIAHSYERKIPQMGVLGFMRVRIIRFLPLLYLGGALGLLRALLLAITGASDVSAAGAIAYFLFLPSPDTTALAPLNGPAWSLLFEVYINLAYAAFLPTLSTRVLTAVVVASGIGLIVADLLGYPLGGAHWNDAWGGLLRVSYSFPLGVLLFRKRDILTFGNSGNLALVALFAGLLFLPSSRVWAALFILIVSPALVVLALRCGRANKLAIYGAMASYAIYVTHWPVLSMTSGVSSRLHLNPIFTVLTTGAGVLLCAPFLDRWFDVPIRRRLTLSSSPSA